MLHNRRGKKQTEARHNLHVGYVFGGVDLPVELGGNELPGMLCDGLHRSRAGFLNWPFAFYMSHEVRVK